MRVHTHSPLTYPRIRIRRLMPQVAPFRVLPHFLQILFRILHSPLRLPTTSLLIYFHQFEYFRSLTNAPPITTSMLIHAHPKACLLNRMLTRTRRSLLRPFSSPHIHVTRPHFLPSIFHFFPHRLHLRRRIIIMFHPPLTLLHFYRMSMNQDENIPPNTRTTRPNSRIPRITIHFHRTNQLLPPHMNTNSRRIPHIRIHISRLRRPFLHLPNIRPLLHITNSLMFPIHFRIRLYLALHPHIPCQMKSTPRRVPHLSHLNPLGLCTPRRPYRTLPLQTSLRRRPRILLPRNSSFPLPRPHSRKIDHFTLPPTTKTPPPY